MNTMSSFVATYFFGINFLLIFCYNLEGGSNKLENVEDHLASPSNLTKWASTEYKIYQYFTRGLAQGSYEEHSQISKSALAEYLKDFEDSNGLNERHTIHDMDIISEGKEVSSNPIMVFRMLYRINKYRKTIAAFGSWTIVNGNGNKGNMWELLQVNKKTLPTSSGATEAMDSILRLHHVYDLNLTEFTSGVIAGIKTNTSLDAIHCFEIGVQASKTGYHDLSIEWLEWAYSKVHFESDSSLKSNQINRTLLESIIKHDTVLKTIPDWVPTVYNDTVWDNYHVPAYSSCNNRTRRKDVLHEQWKGRKETRYNEINFRVLCSGDNYQTEKEKSKLYCWRDSGKNQANVLSPSKIELLSSYPYIVQIYDAIGAELADRIIQKAQISLTRSEVLKINDNAKVTGTKLSKVRTSAQTWMYTTKQELELVKIEKRIESITGLNTNGDATEALQVASYVFGRHYDVHTDTLKDEAITGGNGDRVATFMIYLDEPLAGGFTAFVQAGVAAKPVKGSAVFWYNLNQNGSTLDDITWHGGCPVLLGHKHIANKWIRFGPQFIAAPCPRNQKDPMVNVL